MNITGHLKIEIDIELIGIHEAWLGFLFSCWLGRGKKKFKKPEINTHKKSLVKHSPFGKLETLPQASFLGRHFAFALLVRLADESSF